MNLLFTGLAILHMTACSSDVPLSAPQGHAGSTFRLQPLTSADVDKNIVNAARPAVVQVHIVLELAADDPAEVQDIVRKVEVNWQGLFWKDMTDEFFIYTGFHPEALHKASLTSEMLWVYEEPGEYSVDVRVTFADGSIVNLGYPYATWAVRIE